MSNPTSTNGAMAEESFGHAFVVGPGRSGTRLVYMLLCLHPDVAYLSNLERRLPWVPAATTGRLRLRRFGSKLRRWFPDHFVNGDGRSGRDHLLHRLAPVPVDAESLYCRAAEHVDARSAARMRGRLGKLRQAGDAKIVAARLGASSRRLPSIDAVFPRARYLSVVREGREAAASLAGVHGWTQQPLWWDPQRRTPAEAIAEGEELLGLCARSWVVESEEIGRGLARIPEARVLTLQFETLVAEPVEQMRRVLDFLELERRGDFEWALKALKLGRRSGARRSTMDSAKLDTVIRECRDRLASEYAP